jgi:hypothetical protein
VLAAERGQRIPNIGVIKDEEETENSAQTIPSTKKPWISRASLMTQTTI